MQGGVDGMGTQGTTPLPEVPRGGPSRCVSCGIGTAFYDLTGVPS